MLEGIIIHGEGIGKGLGYPTANIDIAPEKVHLGPGIYAAKALLGEESYIAGLVIVEKPWKVEVHLIDYTGPDIYGEHLQVDPIQRVSTFHKYTTEAELKRKIKKDIQLVSQVFDDPEVRAY